MKLKKYNKNTFGKYFSREIIIIICSLICSLLIINMFYVKIDKTMMPMAESMVRKYVTKIINKATDNIKFDNDLYIIEKNVDNEIKMITYNSYEATQLINEITNNIQDDFDKLENKGNKEAYVVTEIPLGVVFKNYLLRNLGPKIKVKFDIMGDVISELTTEVKPYGINNALVEVRVKLLAKARVILPFASKEITINNIIPISINIVNGSIPEAYISTYK